MDDYLSIYINPVVNKIMNNNKKANTQMLGGIFVLLLLVLKEISNVTGT